MAQKLVARRERTFLAALLAAAAIALALAMGLISAVDPLLGIVAVVMLLIASSLMVSLRSVAFLFVISIFYGESLTFAGGSVTAGRLIAPVGFFVLMIAWLDRDERVRDRPGTVKLIIAFSVFAIMSLSWTLSVSGTLYAITSLGIALVYAGVFAIMIRTHQHLETLLWILIGSSASLGAWWTFSYLAGIDRFVNEAGDPNFFAAYQIMTLPLVMAIAVKTPSPARRRMLYGVSALILVSIASTLSRGGILTLGFVVLVIAFMPSEALFRTRGQKRAFVLVGAIAAVIVLLLVWPDLGQRFEGQRGRLGLWRAALSGFQERPVSGLGFGAFQANSYDIVRRTPGVHLDEHTTEALAEGRAAHSLYLEVLADLGVIGLVLMLLIIGGTLRSFLRTSKRARAQGDHLIAPVASAAAIGLLAFCAASLFLSSQTNRALWFLIGMSFSLAAILESEDHARRDVEPTRE